jgi:hypothetical protein
MNFVEELRWRAIHDIMPGTEEQLEKEMTRLYGRSSLIPSYWQFEIMM